jgi:hypothetical protein
MGTKHCVGHAINSGGEKRKPVIRFKEKAILLFVSV